MTEKMDKTTEFSLIIPAFNEADYLPTLLGTVKEACAKYNGGAENIDVVVADNNSTDETANVACAHGCNVVHVKKRSIAAARNGGARAAVGKILAFIDADSKIHPDTFNAIESCLISGKVVAGSTGVRLERMSMGIAGAYMLIVPVLICAGMDAGVVFCRREDFDRVGGYNENLLAAEDVRFLWDLKRLGKSSGRKLARITSARAIASTRKFDKLGEWHYVGLIFRALFAVIFSRRRLDKIIKDYWYDVRR